MKFPRGQRLSHIGLHADTRCFYAVQGVRDADAPGSFRVLAATKILRDAPALSNSQADRLFRTLARQGFAGHEAVTAVPQAALLSGVLDLPPRHSGAPLDQIARNELARANRCEPDQIESAWWEIPPGFAAGRETEGTQVIAVGCRHADAQHIHDCFEAARVETLAIDTVGAALVRAVRPALPSTSPEPPLSALVEVSHDCTLALILRGHDIVYERYMPDAGLTAVTSSLVQRLSLDAESAELILARVGLGQIPPELAELEADPSTIEDARQAISDHLDALANEVRASASYAGRRYASSLSSVLVTGPIATVPGWTERLGRRLESTTSACSPAALYQWPDTVPADPGFMTAVGLALHPGRMQEVAA